MYLKEENKMGEKIPYRIGNDLFMIGEIQQMYPSPKYGFKEFASNAIDNRLENEALNLGILVSKTNNKIIFVDNGSGITYKTLKMIPFEVGESLKRGVQSAIGEKAFGMMGFPSCFATQCIVYSRRYDSKSDDFNYLRMNADLKAGAFRDIIKPKDVPMLRALPNFGHGTIVELTGIPVDKIEKYFTPGSIKEIISTTFSPLLRKGIISVKVGYLGRNQKKIPIDPVDYTKNSGVVKVLDDVFPVEIKTRKHTIKGEVELYLFVNPKGTGDKVGYYNKGVLVLDDIVDLDELGVHPWGSGKLIGEVDENFVKLIPSRTAPKRNDEQGRYSKLVEILTDQEEYLGDEVNRLKIDPKKDQTYKFADDFLRSIDAVFRDLLDKNPALVRGRRGDPKEKVKDGEGAKGSTRVGGTRTKKPKEEGRSTVSPDPDGKETHVRRARKIISGFYTPNFVGFDVEDQHLRSKLDHRMGLIHVNIDHDDFKKSYDAKDGRISKRYIAHMLSKEVALGEFMKSIDEGNLNAKKDAHVLTELISELYHRGLHCMRIP